MRKLFVVLCTVAVILAVSVSVMATPGGFVESPSLNGAPTVVAEDSDANVGITAYRDRADELDAGAIAEFESAYKSVVGAPVVSTLASGISKEAKAVKVNSSDLAVSDIFYVTSASGNAKVSAKSHTFGNFVCLIAYNGASWSVVDVEVKDDNAISFTAADGVYAVVVSTGAAPQRTQSEGCFGSIDGIGSLCIVATVILAAAFVCERKTKKTV